MKLIINSKGKKNFILTCKINGLNSTVSISSDEYNEKKFIDLIKSKLGQNVIIENIEHKKEL